MSMTEVLKEVVVECPVRLTMDELLERGDSLAQVIQDIDEEEDIGTPPRALLWCVHSGEAQSRSSDPPVTLRGSISQESGESHESVHIRARHDGR